MYIDISMKTRIFLLLLGIAVGAYAGGFLSSETITYYNQTSTMASFSPYTAFDESDISEATAFVPAVDQDGQGVTTLLSVHIVPGTRKALVDIDKLLFWTDTQNSIRVSRSVAENVTGEDLSYYDITYSINANASVIEGPSAGAAMTIATISALTDSVADRTVMITGTINHDGTIGPVGEILAKALAAKENGAETFLVPIGQSQQTVYENRENCQGVGMSRVCSIERIPGKVNVSDQAGIDVVEVRTIHDAMGYFFK
jgi:uncharacterized protein